MNKNIRVAIIGTRNISKKDLIKLEKIIKKELMDYDEIIVHSGNAYGVDQIANSFEKANIFLPWNTYNEEFKNSNHRYFDKGLDFQNDEELSKLFTHFLRSSPGVKKMIRRNYFIICGDPIKKIPNVDIVYWYTGKGVKGGTAYGVKIAREKNIKEKELKLN